MMSVAGFLYKYMLVVAFATNLDIIADCRGTGAKDFGLIGVNNG